MTIAQYIIRSNKTVNYAVIDVDIPKSKLVEIGYNEIELEKYWLLTKRDALRTQETAASLGITSYIVDSGYRGYHVWFFYEEPILIHIAFDFLTKLIQKTGGHSEGLTWELFPHQRKLKENHLGQAIKLPWGKHTITNRQAPSVGRMFKKRN